MRVATNLLDRFLEVGRSVRLGLYFVPVVDFQVRQHIIFGTIFGTFVPFTFVYFYFW